MDYSFRTNIEDNGKSDFLSRPILRTNPKLTTNIKLVVTDENMYLESIDADRALSSSVYKKRIVKDTGLYAYDVAKFWRSTATPFELAFKTKREFSDFSIMDSYDKQFENTYEYGSSMNYSKMYDYDYKMFAPIWLDKNIPSKFIIYRTRDAVSNKKYDPTGADKLSRINDMLADSTLIKVIDLSENSKIGKYLRSHVSSNGFPKSPLTVSFNEGGQTFYNGIDLEKGGFANKDEYQGKDLIATDKPLIEYNDFITDGFFRNKLACANLINLEFMFDDDKAEELSINRYFGLFVDEIKAGEGKVESISRDSIFFSSLQSEMDLSDLNEINPSGNYEYYSLPNPNLMFKSKPSLGWVKSALGYHNIKNGVTWNIKNKELKIDSNTNDLSFLLDIKKTDRVVSIKEQESGLGEYIKIEVIDNPDTSDMFSVFNLKKQRFVIKSFKNEDGQDFKIIDNVSGEEITVTSGIDKQTTLQNLITEWENATGNFNKYEVFLEEINGEYLVQLIEKEYYFEENHSFSFDGLSSKNILSVKQTFTPTKVLESTFVCDNSVSRGKFNGLKFSGIGSLENVASVICDIVKTNTDFNAFLDKTTIYIQSKLKGYNKQKSIFLIRGDSSDFLKIETADVNNDLQVNQLYTPSFDVFKFEGGCEPNKSVFLDEDDTNEIEIGNYLLDKENKFNKIVDIVEDIRDITLDKKHLILDKKNKGLNGTFNVYEDHKLEYGYFSGYDIYDLNFDFFDESNSKLKELNLEPYQGIADNSQSNTTLNDTSSFNSQAIQSYGTSSLENVQLNMEYVYDNIHQNAYLDYKNMTKEPYDYFSTLIPLLDLEKTKDVEIDKIYNEFDRLEENNTSEYALISRITPTINKWSLLNSTNVRENPYYLNVCEAFGETNFSPDLEVDARDPNKMSMEWFYLDKLPNYFNRENANENFSYVNFSNSGGEGEDKFNESKLLNIESDYFKFYFLSNGFECNDTFYKTDKIKRYTIIDSGSSQSFASTIFKGIKFTPKVRKKLAKSVTKEFVKTKEFNGYRFSTILKTEFDTDRVGEVKVKVIENQKFKTITLVLSALLSEDKLNFLNRRLLYELQHKVTVDGEFESGKLDGALPLNELTLGINSITKVDAIPHANGSLPKLREQMPRNPITGAYSDISIKIGQFTYRINVIEVINDSQIKIKGQMVFGNAGTPQSTQFYSLGDFMQAEYSYEDGGINNHGVVLKELTAANISNILNNTKDAEYVTVTPNGELIENRFVLNMESGAEVIKRTSLRKSVDSVKLKSFKTSNEIVGYNIVDRGEYFSILNRQSGNYTVDMRPVVTFTEPFSNCKIKKDNENFETRIQSSIYKKLNGCGVQFLVGEIGDREHQSDWGVIKNQFLHKVNEIDVNAVIKLSEGEAVLPKYRLANEVAIDKIDRNIFKSRWEIDYYVRSLSNGNSIKVPGTKSIIEKKNFMNSSIVKPGKNYDLFKFTIERVKDIEQLNDIREAGGFETNINYIETRSEIIMDFYVEDALIKKIDELGFGNIITKYVKEEDSFGKTETLTDDVYEYIANNIIDLYSISSIDLYVFSSKKIETDVIPVDNISSVTGTNYILDNNFTYKLDPSNPLNFRLIYNKKIGFSYQIKPLIKIKA